MYLVPKQEEPFFTAKLLKQDYCCHKLHKALSNFYGRHSEVIVKDPVI